MTLTVHKVKDLDDEAYQRVYSLNRRKRGFARGHLRDCRAQSHEHSRIVLAWQDGALIGWSILVQCLDAADRFVEYSINLYVRRTARRQGVGSILFNRVNRLLQQQKRKGHVCIWSPASEGFYNAVKSPAIRVIVSPRYTPSS